MNNSQTKANNSQTEMNNSQPNELHHQKKSEDEVT